MKFLFVVYIYIYGEYKVDSGSRPVVVSVGDIIHNLCQGIKGHNVAQIPIITVG